MAGAVIENVSSKKLYTGFGLFLVILIAGFVIGGIFAAHPSQASPNIATECYDPDPKNSQKLWFMPWHPKKAPALPHQHCTRLIESYEESIAGKTKYYKDVQTFNVVHALHLPKMNDELSPWKSFLKVLLYPTLKFHPEPSSSFTIKPTDTKIFINAKIGYRDDLSSPWTLLTEKNISRPYDCEEVTHGYDCNPMDFIELGSVTHKYYLINFRLPHNDLPPMNKKIGSIEHINMPVIYQPDRFTKVWLALQTSVFTLQWLSVSWYSQRLFGLKRTKTLIEKSIFILACGIQVGNFPLQWIALVTDAPWMLLVSDIRTGLVYFILFSFWLIFISEHLLDKVNRNKLKNYQKELLLIIICTCSMFIYDCVERGIQISSPFWSIYDSSVGSRIAKTMPIIGLLTGSIYFCYLIFLVAKVSLNLIRRQSQFVGRLNQEGLVFRFQIVIGLTVSSALFSVIVFNYSQFSDKPTIISGYQVQVNAAMQTGLYVLWNLYVVSLLILYAPSHKCGGTYENTPLTQSSSITSMSSESRNDEIRTITLNHTSTADQIASLTSNKSSTD